MVGGDWEAGGEEELEKVKPPQRPTNRAPKPQPPKLVARKSPECILSRMTHQMEPPPPKRNPPPEGPPPPSHKGHHRPQDKSPQRGGGGMVPTTISSAARSTSRFHGAWRWAPCAVSTGGRRALFAWNTQATPCSMRRPTASSSPPLRPPMNTLSLFARARTPPPPGSFGPPNSLTNPKTDPQTHPKTKPPE